MMLHNSGLVLADPKHPDNNMKYLADRNIENSDAILGRAAPVVATRIDGESYQVNTFKSPDTDWIFADLIPIFESGFTIDTTYSQLPLTDYWD